MDLSESLVLLKCHYYYYYTIYNRRSRTKYKYKYKCLIIKNLKLTFFKETSYEGVSRVTTDTATDWVVVDNLTLGINAAHPWARIFTLLIDTCHVWSTVRTNDTFRSTIWWRADT